MSENKFGHKYETDISQKCFKRQNTVFKVSFNLLSVMEMILNTTDAHIVFLGAIFANYFAQSIPS
jgi:hypothetical protein